MLEVSNLNAGYGAVQVIRELALNVRPGEVVSLVGRNGVGKTTTLKALVGVADVMSGAVVVQGKTLRGAQLSDMCRLGVGYIAQQREVCPDLTVEQNLLLPLYANRLNRRQIDDVYARFERLSQRRKQVAGSLSGGERKLLAFARVMLLKPKVYLIDEPTEGLMPQAIEDIGRLIADLQAGGACVLLVEQNLEMIQRLSTRICLMNNGRIEATVSRLDDHLIQKFLGI
nr:branched-chain amino acid transport ATP-binding protein LivF [uncultured bacterium]